MDIIKHIQEQIITIKNELNFKAGDTITVNYVVNEGGKVRLQPFRGDVIQVKGQGLTKSFTVRKISNGIGVERVFPLQSPNIESIIVHKHGMVRRARIYYIRELTGKAARIKEKRFTVSK